MVRKFYGPLVGPGRPQYPAQARHHSPPPGPPPARPAASRPFLRGSPRISSDLAKLAKPVDFVSNNFVLRCLLSGFPGFGQSSRGTVQAGHARKTARRPLPRTPSVAAGPVPWRFPARHYCVAQRLLSESNGDRQRENRFPPDPEWPETGFLPGGSRASWAPVNRGNAALKRPVQQIIPQMIRRHVPACAALLRERSPAA
jgi:hypothetical protein